MRALQVGDKIRASKIVEGIVTHVGSGCSYVTVNGYATYVGPGVTVEVLKRANDPRYDLSGTTRQHGDDETVVWVKMGKNRWTRIPEFLGYLYTDSDVQDTKVIGTVPNSPAAKALAAKDDGESCA